MQEGVSGAAEITKFDASAFPVRFACEVKGFQPDQYMDRKEARRYDLFAQPLPRSLTARLDLSW